MTTDEILKALAKLSPADAALVVELSAALTPPSALAVTPAIFQSIEQEGRWKPASLMDPANTGRVLQLAGHADISSPNPPTLNLPYGDIKETNITLFTLACSHPGVTVSTVSPYVQFSKSSQVTIDATWWSDGLEIFAGYAGLSSASGFGSVIDDNASITLHAVPFGNYFPAAVFITWTGWFNPQGPAFCEFRGGIVVYADRTTSGSRSSATTTAKTTPTASAPKVGAPCYMVQMERGKNTTLDFDPDGFKISY